jgi:hypothetical protein
LGTAAATVNRGPAAAGRPPRVDGLDPDGDRARPRRGDDRPAGHRAGVVEQLDLVPVRQPQHLPGVVRLGRVERDQPGAEVDNVEAARHVARDYRGGPATGNPDGRDARRRGCVVGER